MFVDRGLDEETAKRIGSLVHAMDRRELLFAAKLIRERLSDLAHDAGPGGDGSFVIGQRVFFRAPDGSEQSGILLHLSKHLASIEDDAGRRWNVPPPFLISRDEDGDVPHFDFSQLAVFTGIGFGQDERASKGLSLVDTEPAEVSDKKDRATASVSEAGKPQMTRRKRAGQDSMRGVIGKPVLSEFEIARYDGLLRRWGETRIPAVKRGQRQIVHSISGNQAWLCERNFLDDGSFVDRSFARASLDPATGMWTVFWMRHDKKWQAYDARPSVSGLEEFLSIIDGDTFGCFFS